LLDLPMDCSSAAAGLSLHWIRSQSRSPTCELLHN